MRKKERQLITVGLVILFAAIAYWAYAKPNIGFIDLSDWLNKNETNDNTTYQLAIENLQAAVLESGHVEVTFTLSNVEHFNISEVKVLYALNIANIENATFTELSTTVENGTYKAEIPSSFGDVVYYKVKVLYDVNKTLESEVKSLTVSDTVAPTVSNITVSYNSTTGNATFTINASDNDAIDHIVLFYAITADGNLTNVTFSNVTLTTSPYEITLTIDENVTDTTYYYVDFYIEAYDLSGNSVRLPANDTFEFYANKTASLVFPQTG